MRMMMINDSLGFDIADTALAMRRAYDVRAARLGVTRSQWRAIKRIEREPGLRQVDLAERLDMEPISLCRIVDKLEEAGLVERRRDPADRRAWRLWLANGADPLLEKLTILATDLGSDAFDGLDSSQIEIFRVVLQRIRENLARPAVGANKASA